MDLKYTLFMNYKAMTFDLVISALRSIFISRSSVMKKKRDLDIQKHCAEKNV